MEFIFKKSAFEKKLKRKYIKTIFQNMGIRAPQGGVY